MAPAMAARSPNLPGRQRPGGWRLGLPVHLVLHASHLAGMPAHDATGLVIAPALDVAFPALDVAFPALILVTAGTAKRPV